MPGLRPPALVLLRRRGIAARYVSGYLLAAPEEAGADSLEVDTHAWLEVLLPAAEEARGAAVGQHRPDQPAPGRQPHVKIGHGRFYADIAPVKGLFIGSATSTLSAAVTLSLLDPQSGAKP